MMMLTMKNPKKDLPIGSMKPLMPICHIFNHQKSIEKTKKSHPIQANPGPAAVLQELLGFFRIAHGMVQDHLDEVGKLQNLAKRPGLNHAKITHGDFHQMIQFGWKKR